MSIIGLFLSLLAHVIL